MKQPNIKKTLLALAVAATCQQSYAAGFQVNAQSAAGLGRAYAGDAVIADDASAMARNPAAMAHFKQTQLSAGAVFVTVDSQVSNLEYVPGVIGGSSAVRKIDNQSGLVDSAAAPNFFTIVPIDKALSVGFGIYSNFATNTAFDDNFEAALFGGSTKLTTINLQFSSSYRINKHVSLGAGIDIIKGEGLIKRKLSANGPTAVSIDAEGMATGLHTGVMYEVNRHNRFGLSYRYSPDIIAEGTISKLNSNTGKVDTIDDDELTVPLPDMYEFSGFHQLTNQFAMHYSAQYIQWSEFDVLSSKNFGVLNEYNWRDTWHYSIGSTYNFNQQWTGRLGYMYDMGAADKVKSISIPDSDRRWFSAGVSYHINPRSSVDFGYTRLLGEKVTVSEGKKGTNSIIEGETYATAHMLGLQYNHKF